MVGENPYSSLPSDGLKETSETFPSASSVARRSVVGIRTLRIILVAVFTSIVCVLAYGLLMDKRAFTGIFVPVTETTVTRSSDTKTSVLKPTVSSSSDITLPVTSSSDNTDMPLWKFWSSGSYYYTRMPLEALTIDETVTRRSRLREFYDKKRTNKMKKTKKNKKKISKKNFVSGNKVIVNVERCALDQSSTSQTPLVESRITDTIPEQQRGLIGWFESLRIMELVQFVFIVWLIVMIVILYHHGPRRTPVTLELV